MSTAEVTFSVGELAAERKLQARKILWAFLAALLVHLVVGYVLAIVAAVRPLPPEVEEEKPVELTIVDTSPVVPPKPVNAQYRETDESNASKEKPLDQSIASSANSIAASEEAPSGDLSLPSQTGKDRAQPEFQNQSHSLEVKGSQAQQESTPVPRATPQASAPEQSATPVQAITPLPTVAPDQFALLTNRPTPPPQPQTTPQEPRPQTAAATPKPSSAYRPERQRTQIGGNISNRGIARINAVGTPLGRYQKTVTDSIGSHWYAYVDSRRDMIGIGTLVAHFVVDRSGKIKDLKILSNTSNETFANVCLQSILEANLPPIPEDVANTLPPDGLDSGEISFTMYAN